MVRPWGKRGNRGGGGMKRGWFDAYRVLARSFFLLQSTSAAIRRLRSGMWSLDGFGQIQADGALLPSDLPDGGCRAAGERGAARSRRKHLQGPRKFDARGQGSRPSLG